MILLSISLLVPRLGTEQIHPGALSRHGIQAVTPDHPQVLRWEPGHAYMERLWGRASQTIRAHRFAQRSLVNAVLGRGPGVCISYRHPGEAEAPGPRYSLRLAGFWVSESYPRLRIIALVHMVSCLGFCKYGDSHLEGTQRHRAERQENIRMRLGHRGQAGGVFQSTGTDKQICLLQRAAGGRARRRRAGADSLPDRSHTQGLQKDPLIK